MQITHSGVTYECSVAVKCEDDRYIKLYDSNGVEIAAFMDISDFSDYTISGGEFIAPCAGGNPVLVTKYIIGGKTINPGNWIQSEDNKYYYEIESDLISSNTTTCDILLLFKKGTSISYTAAQESGKVILFVDTLPESEIVIESIHITRI